MAARATELVMGVLIEMNSSSLRVGAAKAVRAFVSIGEAPPRRAPSRKARGELSYSLFQKATSPGRGGPKARGSAVPVREPEANTKTKPPLGGYSGEVPKDLGPEGSNETPVRSGQMRPRSGEVPKDLGPGSVEFLSWQSV